jgi:dihydroorotate dehydrogenase
MPNQKRFYDDFGKVWAASGALGFFGEGYWFHWFLHVLLGTKPDEITLVAKTTTLEPRPALEMIMRCKYDLAYRKRFEELMGDWRRFASKDCGNMPFNLDPPFQPTERFPKSIWPGFFSDFLGNSIGLSGPGLKSLMETNRWQNIAQNFMFSFMSVKADEQEVLDQYREMAEIFSASRNYLIAACVGAQENLSCPNVGLKPAELLKKAEGRLDIPFPFPRIVKINTFAPVELARDICQHPNCGGICITNTFTIEQLEKDSQLYEKFLKATGGKNPLACYPSAGYSGPAIFPIVLDWLRRFRADGNSYYVNAGGGLNSAARAAEMLTYADSLMLGCAFTKAPWKISDMIATANS